VEEKLVKVTAKILGEDYTIRGRSPKEHIERVAQHVDKCMQEIVEVYPKLGTSRVAVLAAINMADELFKIREQYEQLTQLLEEEWSQRHAAAAVDPGRERTAGDAGVSAPAAAGRTEPETAAARGPTREPEAAAPACPRQISAFSEPSPRGSGEGRVGPDTSTSTARGETPADDERSGRFGHLLTGDALPSAPAGGPESGGTSGLSGGPGSGGASGPPGVAGSGTAAGPSGRPEAAAAPAVGSAQADRPGSGDEDVIPEDEDQ